MKKRINKKIILLIGIIYIPIMLILVISVPLAFKAQYNSKGVSHFLTITIDKSQPKEYIGKLDGYDIYVEKLKIDELNFKTIDAEDVPIKEAIDKKLVSISDWRKHARRIKKVHDTEILKYENYEIAIKNKECVIRPLVR